MDEQAAKGEQKVEVRQAELEGEGKAQKPLPSRWTSPLEEMERLFDEYFPRGWLRRLEWPAIPEFSRRMEFRLPKVDIIDRDAEIVVNAEIPGIEKENLEVSVAGNSVTIKGQTSREEKTERGEYYRCEISRGSFSRTVGLPAEVDGSRAQANFKDGVLKLTLPKKPEAKRQAVKIQ